MCGGGRLSVLTMGVRPRVRPSRLGVTAAGVAGRMRNLRSAAQLQLPYQHRSSQVIISLHMSAQGLVRRPRDWQVHKQVAFTHNGIWWATRQVRACGARYEITKLSVRNPQDRDSSSTMCHSERFKSTCARCGGASRQKVTGHVDGET